MLCDQIAASDLASDAQEKILKLHSLLESALNVRTEIEFRRTRQRLRDLSFFEKIGLLAEKGVDVRSQTWNTVVHFRALLAHNMGSQKATLAMFAERLRERYPTPDLRAALLAGMERLKGLMHTICVERWEYQRPKGRE